MWKKMSLYWKMIVCGTLLFIVWNIAARFQSFCDWYVEKIFPIGVNTYGRFAGLFPFSLGECLIVVAIILVVVAIINGIVLIFLRRKQAYKKLSIRFYKVCLAIVVVVALIYTSNCNILYNCSVIEANSNVEPREYTNSELEILRNYLTQQINQLAEKVERDEDGYAVYTGDYKQEAKKAMLKLSETYSRLEGYYSNPKPITGSRFMSWTGTAGVYFPFTLEANYNAEMYSTMYPEVFCHEYAHLKGYIYEDEANFIGYLACIGSEDEFFQYGGYLSAYEHVDWAYMESVSTERYFQQIQLNDMADFDCYRWLSEEAEEEIYYSDDNSAYVADKLTEISATTTDASLKFYGVEDGIASYDRVTELLLQYYDGILY